MLLAAVAVGAFFINIKLACADVDNWLSYEIACDYGIIKLKVPPNHRFKQSPRRKQVLLDEARPVQQIFSAQYDFGLLKWNDISHFEVVYALARLTEPLPSSTSLIEIKSKLNEMLRRRLGRPSAAEMWQSEIVSLESGKWMRSFDPNDLFAESFFHRCGTQLVLIVSPAYFVDRRDSNNLMWLKTRQSLFKEMVSNIQCQ